MLRLPSKSTRLRTKRRNTETARDNRPITKRVEGKIMTTGDGIVTAMVLYLFWQGFLVWLTTERSVKKPATLEVRIERVERTLEESGIYP